MGFAKKIFHAVRGTVLSQDRGVSVPRQRQLQLSELAASNVMASNHQRSDSSLSSLSSQAGDQKFLGDTVAYFEGELPENILSVLGVHSELSVNNLLDLLREQSGNDKANPDMVERVYPQLAASPRTFNETIQLSFSDEALILTKDRHGAIRWCKSDDCVWEDASAVLGDDFAYLAAQYPKLQDFFVGKTRCQAAC